MDKEPTLAETIGLRHVIEDGLAILDGRVLPEARRVFVIEDLKSLLERAERGSQLLSGSTLFVTHSEASALADYALLSKLVGGLVADQARNQLRETFEAFRELQATEQIEEGRRKSAADFLSSVLANVTADPEWEALATESESNMLR